MLDLLRTFTIVVECGSFSGASLRLNLNASSLARQLDRLENELGQKLLVRSTRQLKLTPAGEVFLPQAKQLVAGWDGARASVCDQTGEVRGTVSITVFDGFGRQHITPIIPVFLAQYPKAQVMLSLDNRVVDLHQEPYDLAIRIGNPGDNTLKCRKIAENMTALVASPDYLERHGHPTHPDDLRQHNCLTLSRPRQQVWWHFQKGNLRRKILAEGNFASPGGDPLKDMALQGLGITLLAHWLLRDHVLRGELELLMPDWQGHLNETGSGDIHLLWSPEAAMRPVVRAMIDFLTSTLAKRCARCPGIALVSSPVAS